MRNAHRFLLVILVVGLDLVSGGAMGLSTEKNEPRFINLSSADSARLNKQRATIAAIVKERYGTPSLTKTKSDLDVLQRLVDDQTFNKMQTYQLQCLGVVFGDVLANEFPLKWVMVTDE